MAKGQKRSTRETKKPKQDKAAASKSAPPFRNLAGFSAIKDVKRVNGKKRDFSNKDIS